MLEVIDFKGLKYVQNTIIRTGKVPLLFLRVRRSHSAVNQERDPLCIRYHDNSTEEGKIPGNYPIDGVFSLNFIRECFLNYNGAAHSCMMI